MKTYSQKNNNKLPTQKYVDNLGLVEWVNNQKRNYSNGSMPEDRKEKLMSVPAFASWVEGRQGKQRLEWDALFNHLVVYCGENNKLPSQKHELIGEWMNNQKRNYSNGSMPEHRKEKLMSIPAFANWAAGLEKKKPE